MTNLTPIPSFEDVGLEGDLLANLFLVPEQYFKSEGLRADLFTCPNHKIIWQVIEEVAKESKSTDGYLVASRFSENSDMRNYVLDLSGDSSRRFLRSTDALIANLTNLWRLREQCKTMQEGLVLAAE